jgi:hypothetical protein
MGLERESIPIIVEPLKLPDPARKPEREKPPGERERLPGEPQKPEKDPAPA